MADDFRANARTTGTVAVGGSATGEIEKRSDVDWFAVELVAGRTYVIDLEGAPGGGGTLGNAMLRGLYDSEGQRIAGTRNDDGGKGADALLTFTATESGTHYIAARSSGPDTGSYTVRVTAFVDPDATAAGATDLGDLAALDGERVHRETVDGGPDGTDYYRFTLGEARTVKLALRYQDADADLHLEDADGNVLHSSTRGGTRNERIEAPLEAETYYVRVVAREEGENAYTLRYRAEEPEAPAPPEPDPLPEPEETSPQLQQVVVPTNVSEPHGEDFSDDTSTLGWVLVGGSVTGEIEGGYEYVRVHNFVGAWSVFNYSNRWMADVDWFAVELEAGKTYRIDLQGASNNLGGTLRDPYLCGIHDADGNLIDGTVDNDGGNLRDSQKIFKPVETATYYVAAGGHGQNQGTYTLKVAEIVDDFTADTGTTGKIAVGGSVTGDIEHPGDRDWFAVELEAGKTYRFDMKGLNTGDGTLWISMLRGIHDADGNHIRGTWHVPLRNGNSILQFTATEDGTHYVAAGPSPTAWYVYPVVTWGTYTLYAEEIADAM